MFIYIYIHVYRCIFTFLCGCTYIYIYIFLGGGGPGGVPLSLSLATRSPKIRGFKRFLTILCFLNVEKRGPDSVPFWIYIYIQKGTLSGPPFSTFLEMQCFCYIMFSPLCSYTCAGIARDPHRLSDFLRGCQRMSRES